jgi:transcriptional regulator GlxA family with amidase domain
MIQVVETFLLHEIKQNSTSIHSVDTVTSNLFRDNFIPSVDDLAESSCQSIRSFERHFKQRMGVSPKYFLKVLRFENAFRMRNKNPLLDWFTIAISCGYYDYQHLARDYKDLSGSTPNQFHEIDLNGPERLFGEADIY